MEFLARCEQYNVDNCLRMVQKYGIADAAILLLERAGDISGALALLIKDLDSSLQIMLQSLISEKSDRFNMEMHSFYSMSEVPSILLNAAGYSLLMHQVNWKTLDCTCGVSGC